jgi:hypothetical protein
MVAEGEEKPTREEKRIKQPKKRHEHGTSISGTADQKKNFKNGGNGAFINQRSSNT